MRKIYFFIAFFSVIFIDQYIKYLFLNGFRFDGECVSLVLVFNKGVAFSIFAFLDEWLKYLQLLLISGVIFYLIRYEKALFYKYSLYFATLFGAGISNLLDRFLHIGVVDYIYWHCYFDFAIFNFADIMIDFSVAMIIFFNIKKSKKYIL